MVKVNVMCGKSDFGNIWLHIDRDLPNKDIFLTDIQDVDSIYCSHGIAYLDRDEVIPLFQAWYNALKSGGSLQLSTPDWDVLRTIPQPLTGPLYGKMSEPPIYHKTVYNYHDLYTILRKVGFIGIVRHDPIYDDQSIATYDGQYISLNITCIKP